MAEQDWLAERFEEHRARLRAVAYRMLGSPADADDAVQEAWLRVSRAGTDGVENLAGWLTTIVARVCLTMLDSRKSRREQPAGAEPPEPAAAEPAGGGPEAEALLADSVGLALIVVLDTLTPPERLAFVLHDMFDVSFAEIAGILGRSPAAARQLASRARRRVRGTDTAVGADTGPGADTGSGPEAASRPEASSGAQTVPGTTTGPAATSRAAAMGPAASARQREVVTAFLTATRTGDFGALLAVLDPDAVVCADSTAVAMGASPVHGAEAVVKSVVGRARGARLALVDGLPGAVWIQGGKLRVVFVFTVSGGKVTAIDLHADPARITEADVVLLEGG